MSLHSTLTGSDLHENKGVAAASNNTVATASGGATVWQKVNANMVDTSSIFNTNSWAVTAFIADIGTAQNVYVPIPFACTLSRVDTILGGAITTANSTLTLTKNGASSMGTITITQVGSAEGDLDSLSPVSNNTFVQGDYVKIANDGNSTGPQPLGITLVFTRTG